MVRATQEASSLAERLQTVEAQIEERSRAIEQLKDDARTWEALAIEAEIAAPPHEERELEQEALEALRSTATEDAAARSTAERERDALAAELEFARAEHAKEVADVRAGELGHARHELVAEQRGLILDERASFEQRLEAMAKRHDHLERALFGKLTVKLDVLTKPRKEVASCTPNFHVTQTRLPDNGRDRVELDESRLDFVVLGERAKGIDTIAHTFDVVLPHQRK